jgi:nucleoside-diphosphate-sugar epimerase
MASVLIAGHGYLGRAAANLFVQRGWSVEAWARSAGSVEQDPGGHHSVYAVDLTNRSAVARAGGDFDLVVHCASTRGGEVADYRSVYFDGARNLLERFETSRVLLAGSTSVYAQKDGQWVTEQSPAQPEHERGKILRETEELVLERDGIVLRLGGIYGPGRSYVVERFVSGNAVIDPEADRYINQIHRDDAAAALLLLASEGSSVNSEVFNVTDDQPILQSDCYRWLAKRLNRPLPPTGTAVLSDKRGRSNKRVSNRKLRGLKWSPSFPTFVDAMEKSVLPSFSL